MIWGQELLDLIESVRQAYLLPGYAEHNEPSLSDAPGEDDESDRYVLLERGHYGQTFVTFHDTPDDASSYSLGQEYAEDWSMEVLIDRKTGKTLIPIRVEWAETN